MIKYWTKKQGYSRMKVFTHYRWNYVELELEGELPLGFQQRLCDFVDNNITKVIAKCNEGKGHGKKKLL